jgi:hypothetical protein
VNARARLSRGRPVVPPPERRQFLLLRQELIQCVAFEDRAVLNDVTNGVGVVDILQRVLAQHDDIGNFPEFKTAQILTEAKRLCAVQRSYAENIVRPRISPEANAHISQWHCRPWNSP